MQKKKKKIGFLILSSAAILSETLCFDSCHLSSPSQIVTLLWLASSHTWASITYNNNKAIVLNQFIYVKLAARHKLCKSVTQWHSVMSWSQVIKGGATDKAFQKQCFLLERGGILTFLSFFQKERKSFYKIAQEPI